ncbi:hypothetical protein GC207_03780 [bacterium]|nr:hypothetical protein [bacterium]
MKTTTQLQRIKSIGVIIFLGASFAAGAQEQTDQKVASEKPVAAKAQPVASQDDTAAVKEEPKPKAHVLPKGIEEIVKMSEAGVGPELLQRFIANSGIVYRPTGADIVEMKKRGVPDEVTMAMLARDTEIKEQIEAARNRVAAPAIVRTLSTDGELDPESYEFFWYHYAYPRALANSYRTLSPYVEMHNRRHGHNGPQWRTDGFDRNSFGPAPRQR